MRVRVDFTVDIDPDAWRVEYGAEDVRSDVRTYIENAVRTHLEVMGVLKEERS